MYQAGTGAEQAEWNPTASSTSVTDPVIPWSIQYGKGSQSGFLNQDVVAMGGYQAETVFASANTLNDVSLDLGLCFTEIVELTCCSAGLPTLSYFWTVW